MPTSKRDHPGVTEGVMDRVVLWMVSGLSGDELINACVGRLNLDEPTAKRTIAEAKKRLVTAAQRVDRGEMLGTAITRLNDLYARALRSQDEARALNVQREINRLIQLHWQESDNAADEEFVREAAEELAAIRAHLAPLGMSEYPVREQVRMLVLQVLAAPQQKGA